MVRAKKQHWKVSLYSMDSKLLEQTVKKITGVAQLNFVKFTVVGLPSKNQLFTVLSSPFIYKTTRDQYYYCQKKRVIYLYLRQDQSIDLFRDVEVSSGVEISVKPSK